MQNPRPVRKFLLLVLGGLLVLEMIWLVGANWALSSDLVIGAINKRPEKLQVLWEEAQTYIPGVIHVEELSVKGTGRRQEWQVRLDKLRVHLSLLSLPLKTFRTYDVKGEGLDFSLAKKDRPQNGGSTRSEAPNTEADLEQAAETSQKQSKRPWRFNLRNIHIEGSERIAVLDFTVSGTGTIDADLALELKGGPLHLERTEIRLRDAEFHARGERAAHDLALDLDAALPPFVPRNVQVFQVLGSMSGRVGISGETTGAGLINQFLARLKSFEVGGPGGHLEADLRLDNGVLTEPSSLRLDVPEGWIQLVDWKINTRFEARVAVDSAAADGTKLALGVEDVAVHYQEGKEPILQDADLALLATSGGIDFSKGRDGLDEAIDRISVELKEALVTDITRFPIPSVKDFSLNSGRLVVASHIDSYPNRTQGKIHIAGQGIDAAFGEVGLVGDLDIDINAESPDPNTRAFTLSESFINIDNVTMTQQGKNAKQKDEGWYAHFQLKNGRMDISEPGEMTADVEIAMRDTRPIITIFSQDSGVIKFFKGMLNFKDLTGTAQVEAVANTTEIQNLDISSKGLQLKANMRAGNGKTDGIMWIKFHGINVGLAMQGGKAAVRLTKPLQWYEEQKASWAGVAMEPKAVPAD